MRRLLDLIFGQSPPPLDDRARQDVEVARLTVRSAQTLRRAERLIRLARIDAEMSARSARQRAER